MTFIKQFVCTARRQAHFSLGQINEHLAGTQQLKSTEVQIQHSKISVQTENQTPNPQAKEKKSQNL